MPRSAKQLAHDAISIGAYRLFPAQRLLLRGDEVVKLGSRALDLLLALADQPGQLVSQKALIAKVWPDVFVEEVSLRFQVAALRKALEEGVGGARYISNVPGRGYSLVAPTTRIVVLDAPEAVQVTGSTYALPRPLERMLGRDSVVRELGEKLRSDRFVTILGPGGVGKTTVALSVADALLEEFRGAVCFVELSPVGDPRLLAATVASAFHLPIQVEDPLPQLIANLRGKNVLLVLDGCEHLIDGVAELAQHLFDEVGDLHILVTSREALRTQGENIRRLPPLTSPPDGEKLSAAEALAYPSAQLFVDRMVSAGASGALSDADADIVSHMCRQLDGIPLAIELTAGRAGLFGLQDTAAGLNSRFSLLWPGRRTSPSRHQTLNATLDWSYSLLSETERAVLRRLSAFSSSFTFGAAQNVGRGDLGEGQFFEAINGLLAKSLVSTEASGPVARYRLLDTTRAYAKQKLEEAGEREDTRRRHALYYCELLRATAADEIAPDMPTASVVDLDEVRSALQWAFEDGADELLGADVAAYSAPLWLSRALLAEGRAWMAKAAATCIDGDDVPGQQQLRIQIAFASTELFTMGFTEATLATWSRTLERANALGSLPAQLLSYQYLWGGEIRAARYVDALARAETCVAVLQEAPDPGAHAMGQWMLGHSKHHTGQFDEARDHLQRSLATDTEAARMASIKATGHDRRVTTQGVLSNVLWILGKPDEAKVWGERAIADARALGFAIPVGLAMSWAGLNTYLSEPDIDVVEGHFVELLEQGRTHSIDSDAGFALCVLGLCQARRNRFDEGSSLVAEGLKALTSARMEVFSVLMRAHICEAAVEAGRLGDALTWMERLESTDWNTDHWCSAEVFRVQGLLAQSQGDERAAAEQMARGIDIARRQGALSWELRATLSASKLWAAQGRTKQALDAIQSVYGKYHQGYGASDLIAARSMMERLSTLSPGPSRWEPTA